MNEHEELINHMMQDPAVAAEVERLEREEFALLDVFLRARHKAALPPTGGKKLDVRLT